MPGAYQGFVTNPIGKKLAVQLGLPRPVRLRRYAVGEPLIDGPVLVGGLGDAPVAARVRDLLKVEGVDTVDEVAQGTAVSARARMTELGESVRRVGTGASSSRDAIRDSSRRISATREATRRT